MNLSCMGSVGLGLLQNLQIVSHYFFRLSVPTFSFFPSKTPMTGMLNIVV